MGQTLKKWGNSLSLRIPRVFTDQLHWQENTQVDASIVDGKLVVEAVGAPRYTLDHLLEGMTAENMHEEISTGTALGAEVW